MSDWSTDNKNDKEDEEIDYAIYGVNVEFDDLSKGEEPKMDFTRLSKGLQPHSIDTFWLQRNLSEVYAEATDSKLKAQKKCLIFFKKHLMFEN